MAVLPFLIVARLRCGGLRCSWQLASIGCGASLWTRSPPVTQDFIDHLRGSLEMILQQIGCGEGVAPDGGFIDQSVFRPDVSGNVRHGDRETAIAIGAGK